MADQSEQPAADGRRSGTGGVMPAELFFDLAFVFCLFQITDAVSDDLTALNLLRGLLMLVLIWTVWASFAWIGNFDRDRADPTRLSFTRRIMIVPAVASLIVLGMAIPQGFQERSTTFVCAFVALFAVYALSLLVVSRGSPSLRGAVRTVLPVKVLLPVSLIAAAIIDRVPWSPLLICAGLAAGLFAGRLRSRHSLFVDLEHADERFSLFVLIVLGEVIIATGEGASANEHFGLPVIGSIVCGVVIATSLWWIYFSLINVEGASHFEHLSPAARVRATRMVYTYLHGLLVVFMAFLAVGLDLATAHPTATLAAPVNVIIPGALTLFILTVFVIRRVITGTYERELLIPAALLVIAAPLGVWLPVLWVEALCAALLGLFVLGRQYRTSESSTASTH